MVTAEVHVAIGLPGLVVTFYDVIINIGSDRARSKSFYVGRVIRCH